MDIIFYGKKAPVSDETKDYFTKRINKIGRLLGDDDVTVRADFRKRKNDYIVEVTIPLKGGGLLRAEVADNNLQKAIQTAVDRLADQLRTVNTRLKNRKQRDAKKYNQEFLDTFSVYEDDYNDYDDYDESVPEIVREKRIAVKPMSPEEAVLQMELIDHDFFVFSNDETGDINIVYKRDKGGYGLIEPE